MHQLAEEGWTVFRTAGSHGCFDIFALDNENLRLIQVKTIKGAGRGYSKKEEINIKNLSVPENVTKEIWVKRPRKEWSITTL